MSDDPKTKGYYKTTREVCDEWAVRSSTERSGCVQINVGLRPVSRGHSGAVSGTRSALEGAAIRPCFQTGYASS
jgi:hypothetical protein